MQFTLKQKLFIIFGLLLAIVTFIGIQSIDRFDDLGKSIDVILRENYRSVIACQEMKEALERIDSGVLFLMLGYDKKGKPFIEENFERFRTALEIESNNLTLPDEPQKVAHLKILFRKYHEEVLSIIALNPVTHQKNYFESLLPLFLDIKKTANDILQANQQNMNDANNRARKKAGEATRDMIIFLATSFSFAVIVLVFSNRWIHKPIVRLINSAYEIMDGNFNLVVKVDTQDEIGHLSEAFNEMIAHLRLLRRSDDSKLIRIRNSIQEVFKNLPHAIAIIDPEGHIEVATEMAKIHFGLIPNSKIQEVPHPWLFAFYSKVVSDPNISPKEYETDFIQMFFDNRENFFQPKAIPIMNEEKELNGLIVILEDVTGLKQNDELKKDLFSTISHQLKTPLTSLRMAVHLLLEEKVGTLNEKQSDLLISARDESERLFMIVEDLLDISRIEKGFVKMNFTPISPRELVETAVESYTREAMDKGIILESDLPDGLPDVIADKSRILHVLGNLLSNAIKYTPYGGKVRLYVSQEDKTVQFHVSDNGKGIPKEFHSKIFEKFFRIPGQGKNGNEGGEGLGLSIAKEIIKAHDGDISFESTEGKGSTFVFTLKKYEPGFQGKEN